MSTAEQPARPSQLQMIWPQGRQTAPAVPATPAGYTLRACSQADVDVPAYVSLLRQAGFETWDETKAQRVFETMLPSGLFFIFHDATGALVATAVAQALPRAEHPLGMELGWVAADPDHRGQGLGHIVCAAATRRLLVERPATMYLLTDDFRLPAIRIYIKLGWLPFLYLPDMAGRWRAVCAQLRIPFEDLKTTTDPTGAT